MNERALLLIVDVQVDFCPGGKLAVAEGDRIIPLINRYIELCRQRGVPVMASRDWHPEITSHFKEYGGIWPPHCIQDTSGAAFHPDLRLPADVLVVSKGTDPRKDDYSTFQGHLPSDVRLDRYLAGTNIRRLLICGLATDYCVRETVLDALAAGYRVTLLQDAIKGVELVMGDSERALVEMTAKGAVLASISDFDKESF
jgi:nicotinamidase/pyrazinamidase